jgi:type I restriction enzyme, S subunit
MIEIELGELYLKKGVSLDPSKFPDETFEYYSIPAYDSGNPEIIKGSEIGSSKKVFHPYDVVLSRIIPHKRRCWIIDKANGLRQIGSGEWITFRSKDIEPTFLRYYLMSNLFNAKFLKTIKGVGGSLMRADPKQVSKFKIPLPPLDQQKKIATILDAADTCRQKTKALIKKYDELTQSLFLDMFGDPVTNPKGWNVFSFKDVLEIRNGKNQKLIENKNGIYPICGSGGVMSYGDDYISEADSVIIGRKGNINKPILMKEKYWHVDTAFGLNPLRSVLEHDYLYWFCVRYNFEQHNKTVTIPSLTKETLLRIKIPIPHIDLQNQFAERVQAIEAQKAQAQASLAQAEDLFNSLLQRAFKGELS